MSSERKVSSGYFWSDAVEDAEPLLITQNQNLMLDGD